MAELEILRKVKRLRHANVAVVLEHHHGERAAGHHVTNDEFGKNIKTKLDVRDGLHDTDGDKPENGD